MKSSCRKLIFPVIYFVSLTLLFPSCDKEEEKPDNHILFNGKKYVINNARLSYHGEADLRHQDPQIGVTHYLHRIRFSDGNIDPTNESLIENGNYKVTFTVYTTMADHSPDLTGGTFSGVHPQDFFGSRAPLDKSFYTFFILRVDDNGNGVFDQGETWYDGLEGDLVITGSDVRFTVNINTNDPTSNTSMDGNYKGVFEVVP